LSRRQVPAQFRAMVALLPALQLPEYNHPCTD
jgi:hypothetical protein